MTKKELCEEIQKILVNPLHVPPKACLLQIAELISTVRFDELERDASFEFVHGLSCQVEAIISAGQEAKRLLVQNGTGVCSNCYRQDHIDPIAKYCRYCGARLE